jgi:hypothetical protein
MIQEQPRILQPKAGSLCPRCLGHKMWWERLCRLCNESQGILGAFYKGTWREKNNAGKIKV